MTDLLLDKEQTQIDQSACATTKLRANLPNPGTCLSAVPIPRYDRTAVAE
jgi:hypothetical protein